MPPSRRPTSRRANASAIAGWRGAAYKACQVIRRMIIAPFCFACGAMSSPLHAVYLRRCVQCTSHNWLIAVQHGSGDTPARLQTSTHALLAGGASCLALGQTFFGHRHSQLKLPPLSSDPEFARSLHSPRREGFVDSRIRRDEWDRRWGARALPLRAPVAANAEDRRPQAQARGRRSAVSPHRHHLRRLRRRRGDRAPHPLRHHPPHPERRRVAPARRPASSSACARSTPSCTTSITARRSSAPAACPRT